MYLRSLKIDERLGHPEGIANAYGNLGLVYYSRGDLDRAEEMHCKSLAIEERLGRLEGMANDYSNLGTVYRRRGDLEAASAWLQKALALFAQIGMPAEEERTRRSLEQLRRQAAATPDRAKPGR